MVDDTRGERMEAGWNADPTGRHQERWFDGAGWGAQVRDHGIENLDAAGVPGGPGIGATAASGPPGAGPGARAASSGTRFGKMTADGGASASPLAAGPVAPVATGAHGVPVAPMVPGSAAPAHPPSVPVVERVLAGSTGHRPAPPAAATGSFGGLDRASGAGGGQDVLAMVSANSVVSGLVAGGIGGGLGMIIGELQGDLEYVTSTSQLNMHSGIWVGLVGMTLGAVLAAWDSLTSSAWSRALRTGGIGAGVGAVAGFVGGYLAQMLFTFMLERASSAQSYDDIRLQMIFARAVAWGVFGGLLGLGLGIPSGSRKIVNGLIGGLAGGAAGGFAFELLGSAATGDQGFVRFLGLVVTGMGIGVGVGLVDRLTRQVWIEFRSGPLRGREVILFKPRTTLGSAPTCDVVLSNDPSMQPIHLTLVLVPGGVAVEPVGPVSVGGDPMVAGRAVRSGEVVELGRSQLVVNQRVGA